MMSKLNLIVCENFEPEFKKVAEKKHEKLNIISYSSFCDNKNNIENLKDILSKASKFNEEYTLICSRYCGAKDIIKKNSNIKILELNNCFNHILNEEIINYIVESGGYLISLAWLEKWEENIKNMGFERETAAKFYKDFCNHLVFLDTIRDRTQEEKLKQLSNFLDIPYKIIPCGLQTTEYLIDSILSEWELSNSSKSNKRVVSELQEECAQYASILDILHDAASSKSKRDVISKMKEIFTLIMGASLFKYSEHNENQDNLSKENKEFIIGYKKNYYFDEENNIFLLKIRYQKVIHGVLRVGKFKFPEYTNRYLNFAISISEIFGLVLNNIEIYEELVDSREILKYKSYHDSLTDLYNRTFLNELTTKDKLKNYKNLCVFSFDIDNLKQINDNYGHLEGDKVIEAAGHILKFSFRENDYVFRTGGDEFLSIIIDCDETLAKSIKNRILSNIKDYNSKIDNQDLYLSLSIGFFIGKDDLDSLISESDKSMYNDKKRKKKS